MLHLTKRVCKFDCGLKPQTTSTLSRLNSKALICAKNDMPPQQEFQLISANTSVHIKMPFWHFWGVGAGGCAEQNLGDSAATHFS